jgi:hypothetical protein
MALSEEQLRATQRQNQIGEKFDERKATVELEGAEANTRKAHIEAKYADEEKRQGLAQGKAQTDLTQMQVDKEKAEQAYQNSSAAERGFKGAGPKETVREYTQRLEMELKQNAHLMSAEELKLKQHELQQAKQNAPLQRALLGSQIAAANAQTKAALTANEGAEIAIAKDRRGLNVSKASGLLLSRPQTQEEYDKVKAELAQLSPGEIAEALSLNASNKQQREFMQHQISMMVDPEFQHKIEQKREALKKSDQYKQAVSLLNASMTAYSQDGQGVVDTAAAEQQREQTARALRTIGYNKLADIIEKGWRPSEFRTTVQGAMQDALEQIKNEAHQSLINDTDVESVRKNLEIIGPSKYQTKGSGDKTNPFAEDPAAAQPGPGGGPGGPPQPFQVPSGPRPLPNPGPVNVGGGQSPSGRKSMRGQNALKP